MLFTWVSFFIQQEVVVRFCDFGDIEKMPTSRIRRLQDTLYKIPIQAIKCKLHNVILPQVN